MSTYEFRRWCGKAVSGILFPPDREKVYAELMAHMEDHYDYLLEQGCDAETARQMTVESMGSAEEIAPQLAEIHRPFWGRFLFVTREILILAAVITLIPFIRYIWNTVYYPPMHWDWNIFSEEAYGGNTGRTLLHLSQPDIKRRSDGYTFTLSDAVLWQNEAGDSNCFCVYMEEFHPLPWAVHDEAGSWFWAEDSLGNVYGCDYARITVDSPTLYSTGSRTGLFTCTYAMWLNRNLPVDAQWVDIRYTRDGRNLVFRVELTGGDAE